MTIAQTKAKRRQTKQDPRYKGKRRDPEAARRREDEKVRRQREMTERKGKKK
jgi:hypothetical protein